MTLVARVAKQSHIPFRNSTLTYLLQDSLSQDSKVGITTMFNFSILYHSKFTYLLMYAMHMSYRP